MYLTVNANKTSVWASDGDLTIPGDLTEGSDERIKTNVQTLSSALDKVNQMRGVSFDRLDSGSSSVGLIAQELESIAPELVKTLDSIPIILDDGSEIENSKSICYTNLTAYLIEAVKELSAKVTTLEAQVSGSN
jgi:outer membrane murein-binding lipoprotein Lpp